MKPRVVVPANIRRAVLEWDRKRRELGGKKALVKRLGISVWQADYIIGCGTGRLKLKRHRWVDEVTKESA